MLIPLMMVFPFWRDPWLILLLQSGGLWQVLTALLTPSIPPPSPFPSSLSFLFSPSLSLHSPPLVYHHLLQLTLILTLSHLPLFYINLSMSLSSPHLTLSFPPSSLSIILITCSLSHLSPFSITIFSYLSSLFSSWSICFRVHTVQYTEVEGKVGGMDLLQIPPICFITVLHGPM